MRDEGVIQRYGAVLSPAALGHPLTIVAEVETESEQIELLDAMKQSFRDCPQVQQCYYVTGEWDFILVFVVRDMAQYTALTRQLFFQSNNVKRFRTLVTMDAVKLSLDVPVALGLIAILAGISIDRNSSAITQTMGPSASSRPGSNASPAAAPTAQPILIQRETASQPRRCVTANPISAAQPNSPPNTEKTQLSR